MGRRATRKSGAEYPFLAELGLKTATIRGDGNCLFRAFSDQLYGDQSHSSEIRAKVVKYMSDHPDDFKSFVNVEPHGRSRRNPKRKNTAAPALDAFGPTTEQIDQAWEQHLVRMARDGEYGDNLEVRAFGAAYSVDIRLYLLPKMAYLISCGEELAEGESRQIVHIALNAEHYSSVRNLNDPGTGIPVVRPSDYDVLLASQLESSGPAKKIEQWMIKSVSSSLPNFVAESAITEALKRNKGDVDATVSQLIVDDNSYSPSPTPSTSSLPSSPESAFSAQSGNYSIARDSSDDDDEDDIRGPNRRKIKKEEAAKKGEEVKIGEKTDNLTQKEEPVKKGDKKTEKLTQKEEPVTKAEKKTRKLTSKKLVAANKNAKKTEKLIHKKEEATRFAEAAITSWHLITLRI